MIITVIEGPDAGKSLQLTHGKRVLIGRDATSCDLVLTDDVASRKHAEISMDDRGRVFLTDLGSQNGTYLKNNRITGAVSINPGDRIGVGDSILELSAQPAGREVAQRQQPAPGYDRAQSGKTRHTYQAGKVIAIGRDAKNDVTLDHPHVSRFHAVIEITDQGSFIRDLNSTNGTYVDGARVEKRQALTPSSVIRISGYRMTLEDFELVRHDETEGQVDIEVRDLSKVVDLPSGEELVILNNINFKVKPREFVAILGGSGAGKSTMLKALMGTSPATFGEIIINGTNFYEEHAAFKSMTGYVPQDDIVHMELTVEEVLQYAARLRMPDDTTADERSTRVEEVMEVLELTFRRDTPVKRLSGGQRKRVSIGVEIITKPSIMFLDEPTSGLDPGLEKLMMQMMRNMANRGQTIFCVTHATFNIHLCDKIVFLTEGGRLAFFGSPREALEYFGTDDFAEIYRRISLDESPEDWQRRYNESHLAARYYPQDYEKRTGAPTVSQGRTSESSIRQWMTLTSRYFNVMARDRKNLLLLFLQPILIAVGVGLLFAATPVFEESKYSAEDLEITTEVIMAGDFEKVSERIDEETKRIEDINVVLLITLLTAVWFGTANSVSEIVKENSIYKRERSVNLRIAPYLLSKSAVLGIVCFVQSLIFVTILWALIGFPGYVLFVCAFFLIIFASAMMGLAVSAFVASASSATSMLPLLLMPQVVLSGGLMPIDDIEPEFVQAIFALAISKWGFELVGGGILDVNSLIAFEEGISAFEGTFGAHWLWLIGLAAAFYVVSTLAMLKKDKDLA